MTKSNATSRNRLIAYWVTTVGLCLPMLVSGVFDVIRAEQAIEIITRLGYPEYFLVLIGVAKLLGVVALLAPGLPRVKEWAYAGFTFDLIGALVSHLAVGDPILDAVMPAGLLVVLAASYLLRPPSRRLPDLVPAA